MASDVTYANDVMYAAHGTAPPIKLIRDSIAHFA